MGDTCICICLHYETQSSSTLDRISHSFDHCAFSMFSSDLQWVVNPWSNRRAHLSLLIHIDTTQSVYHHCFTRSCVSEGQTKIDKFYNAKSHTLLTLCTIPTSVSTVSNVHTSKQDHRTISNRTMKPSSTLIRRSLTSGLHDVLRGSILSTLKMFFRYTKQTQHLPSSPEPIDTPLHSP
jgi:hypothetical protein